MIGTLDDYLNPPETDELLLKSYYQAMNSNLLLANAVPFQIASHHVRAHKEKLSQKRVRQPPIVDDVVKS